MEERDDGQSRRRYAGKRSIRDDPPDVALDPAQLGLAD
jgi:hypothetical protein